MEWFLIFSNRRKIVFLGFDWYRDDWYEGGERECERKGVEDNKTIKVHHNF